MSQDIDIDEYGNLENAPDGHIQTQTAQNSRESSICTGKPVSINVSKASGPESSSFLGGSNLVCEPFGKSNEKEVNILEP